MCVGATQAGFVIARFLVPPRLPSGWPALMLVHPSPKPVTRVHAAACALRDVRHITSRNFDLFATATSSSEWQVSLHTHHYSMLVARRKQRAAVLTSEGQCVKQDWCSHSAAVSAATPRKYLSVNCETRKTNLSLPGFRDYIRTSAKQ
jgi:hypothetical protein